VNGANAGGVRRVLTATRQSEGDPQSVWLVERGRNVSVVGGGDRGGDGQTQAGTGTPGRNLGPVEPVEDASQLVRRHSGTIVADLHDHESVALAVLGLIGNPFITGTVVHVDGGQRLV
jgi:hypothetical protein